MAEGSIASVGVQPLCSREERVVRVGHSGHCVDLEVLVGTVARDGLNRAPVGKAGLGIVEPLVAKLLDVIVVNVSGSLGNLTSWDSSAELKHILTNSRVDRRWSLSGHELVVEVVSTSDNFNIVEIVSVDGWKANTAIVHLSSENFVAIEPVAENATVRVGRVQTLLPSDIRKVT